jgi:hypothetical protein
VFAEEGVVRIAELVGALGGDSAQNAAQGHSTEYTDPGRVQGSFSGTGAQHHGGAARKATDRGTGGHRDRIRIVGVATGGKGRTTFGAATTGHSATLFGLHHARQDSINRLLSPGLRPALCADLLATGWHSPISGQRIGLAGLDRTRSKWNRLKFRRHSAVGSDSLRGLGTGDGLGRVTVVGRDRGRLGTTGSGAVRSEHRSLLARGCLRFDHGAGARRGFAAGRSGLLQGFGRAI